jgi:hypothetical protein
MPEAGRVTGEAAAGETMRGREGAGRADVGSPVVRAAVVVMMVVWDEEQRRRCRCRGGELLREDKGSRAPLRARAGHSFCAAAAPDTERDQRVRRAGESRRLGGGVQRSASCTSVCLRCCNCCLLLCRHLAVECESHTERCRSG